MTAGLYRKRPVIVEASRLELGASLERAQALSEWCGGSAGIRYSSHPDGDGVYVEIPTLAGTMRVDEGDYVIRGVAGEFYPCSAEIFAATYESVLPGGPHA